MPGPSSVPVSGRALAAKAWNSSISGIAVSRRAMPSAWDQLYAVQDWVLARFKTVPHGFHLSGRTALSRGYYV